MPSLEELQEAAAPEGWRPGQSVLSAMYVCERATSPPESRFPFMHSPLSPSLSYVRVATLVSGASATATDQVEQVLPTTLDDSSSEEDSDSE